MNIPIGYRRLNYGEKQLNTDMRQMSYCGELTAVAGADLITPFTADNFPNHGNRYQFLRKIDSPWISVKERLPKPEEYPVATWNGEKASVARIPYKDGSTKLSNLPCAEKQSMGDDEKITHWMSLPKAPEPIIPPIIIQEGGSTHELIFNKDGSIKAGCVTIDKEKMNQIVERWKKEQE